MDSPRREQCAHASELQGSPIFKFLCSLSPIKQAKSVHVAQTYSELSFPAPPAVFASPPAKVSASKRNDFQGKSDSTAAHDDYDNHISTSPSENGIREESAASDLTCSPGALRTWRSKNLRSSRRPSGCGAAFLTCRSTQVAAIESHCLSAEGDLQTTSNLPVQELERSPDEQEISENPVEDTSEKPPALSFFLSGEVEEMSSFSEDSASLGVTNEELPGCEDIANSQASEMEPLPISGTNDLASKEVIHQDEEEKSSRMTKVNQRGARRRCLDFDDSQTLQAASTENTLHSGMPLSLVSPGSTIPSSMLSDSALDTTIASTSCTQSYVTSTMSLMSNSASSARFSDLGTLPSDTCKTTQLIRDAIPSGIGLHLNSLTNSLGLLAAPRGTSLQSLVSSSQEMQSEGFGKCKLTVSSGRGNMPGSALNLRPGLLVSVVEKTRMDQQELQGSAGSEGGLVKSTTCVRSLTLGIQALEECLPFEIEKVVTPGRKRLSLQQDSIEGETSRTPKKKRKSLTSAEKGDGCKRCHCKKSKCLKLYCECFAAGVYCLDSCACRDCFNKPEYAETVIGTRQQIETRNPLAFAPKIVQASESTPAEGVKCPDTSTSARHKRGCNCKKSLCLKKYCECYQAGVGCSEGCRCNGCKNIYGVKRDPEEVDQLEDQSGDLLKSKNTIASISPITPTFQHTPGLDMPPDSSGFSKSIFGSGACAFGAESTRLFPSSTPDVSLEQPSPRWEVLDDICTITPLPQHPLRPPTPSTMIKSDVSPFSSQPGQSPMSAYPVSSDGCSFLPCDSGNTPTPCPSSPFSTSVSKFIDSNHLLSDETPEFLRDDHSPRTMMKGSPKQKRVVPPNTQGMLSGSSSVLRSGRKLTLQALPSLPPVTPFSFTQGQGYRRS